MLDGESMADHTLKTKMQIILCDHTPSECQDSVMVTIQVPDYYHELVMAGPVQSDILA